MGLLDYVNLIKIDEMQNEAKKGKTSINAKLNKIVKVQKEQAILINKIIKHLKVKK